MRDVFPGYYKPTKDELSELWDKALIVLDTNALFNLFRYSNVTRQAFLSVLEDKKERLWIPHQVGLEFQRGRLGIIKDQSKAFNDLIEKSEKALATVTKDVGTLRNHPTLDLDVLRKSVSDAVTQIKGTIESTREKYQQDVLDASRHDETTDKITELYSGRVGQPYDKTRLEEIYVEGETRYEAKQPPGFKDANKPVPERYGDLILWLQVMDKAEADEATVIFVSEDQKEDWWREFDGKKIGPRVELVDEFMQRTGKRAYFLTPPGLVALAKEHGATIADDTVREITEVSEEQARLQRRFMYSPNHRRASHVSAHELEERVLVLSQRRKQLKSNLRRLSERRDLLSADDPDSRSRYEQISKKIALARHELSDLEESIRHLEIEILQREPSAVERFGWHRSPRQRVSMARDLLANAGVPVLGDEADWFEVPPHKMESILEAFDAGHMPREVEVALRELPMLRDVHGYAMRSSTQEAIRNQILNADTAEGFNHSTNRDGRTRDELRTANATRHQFFTDDESGDDASL